MTEHPTNRFPNQFKTMADNDPPQEQNWRIKPTATQTNHKIGQNHNRCSSLDLTTQTINNRRSCQILTARILRTLKSGCRTGTPQKKTSNHIIWHRSWYKIRFNFYNKSSLQRPNYPSARHVKSEKVKHTYGTSQINYQHNWTVYSDDMWQH